MLSSLLRPRNRRMRSDKSPYSSPFNSSPLVARNGQENDYEDIPDEYSGDHDGGEDELETPLLPIFSSPHLDKLPLYNITHSCRILIVQKCETSLTWDQLRSPQVSQFLVKPIQSQIRKDHFNRATICALIANCLQFQKECQQEPGNAGVSKTRAMISELLAMRLLKDYTIRELIDALSYDFDPLQGTGPTDLTPRQYNRVARISTVEVAIRAQAKRFLAHPLVIQQLEAIWAGTIVFHSAADNLHRKPPSPPPTRGRGYGTIENSQPLRSEPTIRRSVTLYNPKDASLFKLSRLRVPRYRQLFSTISFVIMLGLFLAILVDRSVEITPLEVIFWFWSAGYMLDELVGFSEQGFGLYIMSVWNALDLGILLLFLSYYVLRLYGILIPAARKHYTSHMAYDVLASTAVLLFPRAFSILDHYKYFSQLLIAFRLMVQDMVAILVLIVIACSGFFVAFTLSFSEEKADASKVAYALFQMIMGFTPAAWEVWPKYNFLGKFVLVGFLFLCHFLIVTILITVLTNSFMAIVQNANEEHQFLFAVNTISMVKSDALFSYIPPTNLLGWVAAPLRYIIPFRKFVKFNRTMIKVTHLPILFSVFTYERLFLFRNAYTPLDLVERQGRTKSRMPFSLKQSGPFSPSARLREPSVVSFHKDRALEEVFRRPFDSTARTEGNKSNPGNRKATVVDNWMQEMGNEGGASPPMEQPRSVLERLENRKPGFRRAHTGLSNSTRLLPFKRDFSTTSRSVVSDPEDAGSTVFPRLTPRIQEETDMELEREDMPQDTDADGDDELLTNDGDNATATGYDRTSNGTPDLLDRRAEPSPEKATPKDYFDGAMRASSVSNATRARLLSGEVKPQREPHQRVASHNTIVYSPAMEHDYHSSSDTDVRRQSRPHTAKHTNSGGTTTPIPPPAAQLNGRKAPRPAVHTRPRPMMQYTAPDLHNFARFGESSRHAYRQPSFNAIALDLASNRDDDHHRYIPEPLSPGYQPSIPASFSEQMLREREFTLEMEHRRQEQRRRSEEEEEKGRVGRIMLARMNTLEEGFKEVLREVRGLANTSRGTSDAGLPSLRTSLLPPSEGTATRPRTPVGRNSNSDKPKKSPKKGRKGKCKHSVNSSSGEADAISPLTIKETDVQNRGGAQKKEK